MIVRPLIAILAGIVLAFGTAAGALAMGSDSGGSSSGTSGASTVPPQLRQAETLVKAGNYEKAVALLDKVVADDPDNADAENWLGYAYRNMGEFRKSLNHYDRALAIDPNHRGAHEYLGELYLKMDDVKSAEAQLARLNDICTFGCDEYKELNEAIKAYKNGGSVSSNW